MLLHLVCEGEKTTRFRQFLNFGPKMTTLTVEEPVALPTSTTARDENSIDVMTTMIDGRSTEPAPSGFFSGPSLLIAHVDWLGGPAELSASAWATACIGVLMAIWWATEAVPIAVTAHYCRWCLFPMFGVTID